MIEIKTGDTVFQVDYEKTREYYKSISICDCCCCRNLYAQIKDAAPELAEYLSIFGVDIAKPDEALSVEMTDYIEYPFVGYTVTGMKESMELYETKIGDLKVTIANGDDTKEWFPNRQKEPCFYITVYGLSLPWVLDEPFPRSETFKERIVRFFKSWQ